jgi:polyisoprenoid-binding protein YceI
MRINVSLLAAVFGLASTVAHAEWELDGSKSSFYYVTNKAAAVSEVNSFSGLSGGITDAGAATLSIDLATVDTAIDVRNQRMRDIVFQVAQFPKAEIALQVDAASLKSLDAGSSTTGSYTAKVSLHGVSADVPAELQIIKLDADTVQVQLAKPLIVAAATFGLTEGVEELRTVASLTSITPNVVVDFTLVYKQ